MQTNRAQGGDQFIFIALSAGVVSLPVTISLQYVGVKALHASILAAIVMVITAIVLTEKL